LIQHPAAVHEYEQLKIKLAKEHTYNREQYTNAKNKFIEDVLIKAQNELS
jgi:GrpB-like predicted nucleotidyltransferase (UPF0157 family)